MSFSVGLFFCLLACLYFGCFLAAVELPTAELELKRANKYHSLAGSVHWLVAEIPGQMLRVVFSDGFFIIIYFSGVLLTRAPRAEMTHLFSVPVSEILGLSGDLGGVF